MIDEDKTYYLTIRDINKVSTNALCSFLLNNDERRQTSLKKLKDEMAQLDVDIERLASLRPWTSAAEIEDSKLSIRCTADGIASAYYRVYRSFMWVCIFVDEIGRREPPIALDKEDDFYCSEEAPIPEATMAFAKERAWGHTK